MVVTCLGRQIATNISSVCTTIADTFAWVLMPNHFHLLVKVKDEEAMFRPDRFSKPVRSGYQTTPPHQYFSNLFNAYTKAFNKRFARHGNLFDRPFKRKAIGNEWYLKQVILYT